MTIIYIIDSEEIYKDWYNRRFNGDLTEIQRGFKDTQPHATKLLSQLILMSLNTKKKMTSKQKEARMKNLEKGRMRRMESLKQKKESKAEEYDLSSDAEWSSAALESPSDDDAFVISRKKKKVPREVVMRRENHPDYLQKDVDELKSMVKELAILQQKQSKSAAKIKSRTKRSSSGEQQL